MRQTLCQEYLWKRAIILSSEVSWSLWPSSRSAASVSRASVVIFLSASAVMVSSSERVVRGSFRASRNPTTRLEESRLYHRRAEPRGGLHPAGQPSLLALVEAAR